MLAELKTKFANMKALLPYNNQNDQPAPLDQQKMLNDHSGHKNKIIGKRGDHEMSNGNLNNVIGSNQNLSKFTMEKSLNSI